jgi:centromere protein I
VTRPNHLDQASLGAIVRHLYPSQSVSEDLVFKVVGGLGHGELKPSLPIQAALLRWLVMVYHVIDPTKALGRAYPVLFNLLDTAAIRFVPSPTPGVSGVDMDQATAMPCVGLDHEAEARSALQDSSPVCDLWFSLGLRLGYVELIRHRLELSRRSGSDPVLVGLLRVYKDYYPEIIVGDAIKGKASAFKVGRFRVSAHGSTNGIVAPRSALEEAA